MISTILEYIGKDGNEKISIGTEAYIQKVTSNDVFQVIGRCSLNHTESDRELISSASQEELYAMLSGLKDTIYFIRPN